MSGLAAENLASRRPTCLAGLDPAWSRTVTVPDADGLEHRWHVLDNGVEPTSGTMLCVHGNPTWSYLWRRFLAAAPAGWRVVAVDQLGMGWSERRGRPRRLADRIADLGALTTACAITGPTVVVAHDWGGPISLGWALAHRDQLAGLVLTNTAVNLPVGSTPPGLIRLSRSRLLRSLVCVRTAIFVRGAPALSRPRLPREVRRGLAAPYGRAGRRRAIGGFVADIPVEADHPSRATLAALAAAVPTLQEVPALMVWGARDPVFSPRHLEDLLRRLPQADVQWYGTSSHLVTEDQPQVAAEVWRWVQDRVPSSSPAAAPPTSEPAPGSLWGALTARAGDHATAIAELAGGTVRTTSFADLDARIQHVAAGLAEYGVGAGQRVALLVQPGLDLTVAVYACWRLGAVIVIADAGLGLRGLGRALRSAGPDHVIGRSAALVAAGALRVPGRRIAVDAPPAAAQRVVDWGPGLAGLAELGEGLGLPELDAGDADAAILFTSGATGPAKGVRYRRSQLRAQLDAVGAVMGLGPDDRLVAAFAPFALYGPALGVAAAVPDMTVTSPGTLTAAALADAVAAIEATVVFASPAALRNVVATAGGLTDAQRAALGGVRRLMSAGAPVPVALLRSVQTLLPAAELHTPYGMTEVLPVADISLAGIEAAGSGNGVCVGHPLPTVQVRLSPLDRAGAATGELTTSPGVTGEICVAAPHLKESYDRLWAVERQSSRTPGWHRSGDVGHFDEAGRLWVEGRLVHVVTGPDGPITPVGVEQRMEALPGVEAAAAVGVGPAGTQQLVLVVVTGPGRRSRRERPLAGPVLSADVREAAGVPVAAVLTVDALPVDIRHASKVDRARVARWAGRVLSGRRAGRL